MGYYTFLKKWLLPSQFFIEKKSLNILNNYILKIMNFSNQFGLFPIQRNILTCYVCLLKSDINTFKVKKKIKVTPYDFITLPYRINFQHSTEIDFIENQISQSLIDLSSLIINHPSIFLHTRVQSIRSLTCL